MSDSKRSQSAYAVSSASSNLDNEKRVNRIAQDLLELQRSAPTRGQTAQRSEPGALSEIEQAILRSTIPINISETEEVTVNGFTGILANKPEIDNWKGEVDISLYPINEDASPQVITKRPEHQLEYVQELAIRYLRPPTPPAPGEIVIQQEPNVVTPPAPPLVLRQQPPRPDTPEPLVIREAPPQPPQQVGRKVITISGKRLPPPPRKVVIERLAPLPSKPQSVIVERWLPYSQVKRRVIFQKACEQDPVLVKPRNVIVQWQAPEVLIKKEFKYLGVIRANPAEYVQRFGSSLKLPNELPDFVLEIKTPEGLVLAADFKPKELHELEGDVQALKLVDLDKEGLGHYKPYLQQLGSSSQVETSYPSNSAPSVSTQNAITTSLSSSSLTQENLIPAIERIFKSIDRLNNGRINVEDAEKVLLRLNSRLGRTYGEDDVKVLFNALDVNNDGSLDLEEFKKAFLNLSVSS